MKRLETIAYFAVLLGPFAAVILAITVVAVLVASGCTPRVARVAAPISSSHSQLTASDYDLAEAAFAGEDRAVAPAASGWTDAECQELLDRRDGLLIAAATLGTLTGVGGITTLVPKDTTEAERKAWDLGVGLSTLLCGATASTLTLAAQALSTRYERNCRTEKPAPPAPVEHPASDELELAPSPFDGAGDGSAANPTDPTDGGVQ